MLEALIDTLLDGVKLIPFLFLSFFVIELLEHKMSKKNKKIISKSGKLGPLLGGLLGLFPQCGFSVMATNLYITRIVSIGTLISIYLSTSDEMLPIFLSENVELNIIIKILSIKFLIGMLWGFIIDFILRKTEKKQIVNYDICDEGHCHCKKGIIFPAVKHTFNTLLFIMIITFVLNVLLEYAGEDALSVIFLKNSIFGPFISSLVGLIPNCGASVMITELYLNNAISLGSAMAGLLTGSGVAILVLFRSNKDVKENLTILGLVYFLGSISGVAIEIIGMIF